MREDQHDPKGILEKYKGKIESWPYDIIKETTEEFSIGQVYEDNFAKIMECRECGTNEFTVAIGGYYTAIKCPNCKYEICIHEG